MGHLQERYNARARKSGHSVKRRKHSHQLEQTESADANVEIHVPKPKDQKDEERRERLRQELLEEKENSKLTSVKKKRLEKYIDKKLKKEERVKIFEKLAQSQAQVSGLLQLQPSSTLGSRKTLTNEEIKDKVEDKQVRHAMDGRIGGRGRKRNTYSGMDGASEDDEYEEMKNSAIDKVRGPEIGLGTSRESPFVVEDEAIKQKTVAENNGLVVGSALRRDEDGTVQMPKTIERKKGRSLTSYRSWGKRARAQVEEESSDTSFDSSDSANDISNDESHASDDETKEAGVEDEWKGFEIESHPANDTELDGSNDDGDEPIKKLAGFKDWAMQQLSASKEYVAPPRIRSSAQFGSEIPSGSLVGTKDRQDGTRETKGPLGESLQLPETSLAQQFRSLESSKTGERKFTKLVTIQRPFDVQFARLELPILAEEQPIVEVIRLHPAVVLCGETGSGKTTQVPQFLYEAGFGNPDGDDPGMIGITQPRRVAAMSMAKRVGQELNLPSKVAYQVRYDTSTAPSTVIKFMTDGVLLRELASDFTLNKYSVIIVDEAHERSVNTDILIGVLSRVVRLREEMWKEGSKGVKPLRLLIMSATLRVSDFTENATLFTKPPPIIRVDARQYPVSVHFARRTYPDYVSESIKKACKIHARLPPGGILIFLTGQNEITGVCKKLEARFGEDAIEARKRKRNVIVTKAALGTEAEGVQDKAMKVAPAYASVEVEEMELGDFINADQAIDDTEDDRSRDLDPEALDSDEEEEENKMLGIDSEESEVPMHILPLYSILPTDQQMEVFKPPPEGSRLVVVATNVAETSLTIPGIRYVVDCGRAKERCYDIVTGVQSFCVNWISKASAAQRAGRAGRTGPGHCYRLYSSALFENHFDQFAHPEILKMPIEGVVLQMKSMHIDTVTNFPFPTAPDRTSLRKAEQLLVHLGAISSSSLAPSSVGPADGPITELGRAMALFPLSPRYSRMLVSGRQHGCLPYVIAIVAALSVGDPFLHEEALQDSEKIGNEVEENELNILRDGNAKAKQRNGLKRKAFFKAREIHTRLGNGMSDILRMLSVVGAYEFAKGGQEFCQEHFVRPKAMEEIHKLRAQINSIVSVNFPGLDTGFVNKFAPPSDLQVKVLRQLICAAFIDHVAVRKDLIENTVTSGNKYASCQGVIYRAMGVKEDAYIHPSSVLFAKAPPDFIVYQEAMQSSKLWLKTLTVINPAWLSALGRASVCTFSKPMKNSSGQMMVIPRFGPDGWELPAVSADVTV